MATLAPQARQGRAGGEILDYLLRLVLSPIEWSLINSGIL